MQNRTTLRVALVSTFGPGVRGVSPYADPLLEALRQEHRLEVCPVDYAKAFPDFLLPADTDYAAGNDFATLHYLKPATWTLEHYEARFDVVHLQYWSPAFLPIISAVAKRVSKRGARIVTTWHNPLPHERLPGLGVLERRLADRSDLIICHSENGARNLERRYGAREVALCHHGSAVVGAKPATDGDFALTGLERGRSYLLFFGNIRPYKGVDLLLDAWAGINTDFPQATLLVAGRLWGGETSLAARLIGSLAGTASAAAGVEDKLSAATNVHAEIGFVAEDRLDAFLRIAGYSVFPYRSFESQSGAVARAAGMGVPVICTDVGGLKDYAIDDRFVCEPESVESLEAALRFALSNRPAEFRGAQLDVAKRYSWQDSARRHAELYASVTQISR